MDIMTSSSISTPTLTPSQLAAAQAAESNILVANPGLNNYTKLDNFSSVDFDAWQYETNSSLTGCYRKGALPLALALNDTCLPGFYCPNSSDKYPPQYCHPSEQCQVMRDNKATCDPQGWLEPKVCANGFYCPDGGKQQIVCPAGTFCPSGSNKPFSCAFGAICPPMSSRQITIVPLVLVMVIDVVLIALVLGGSAVRKCMMGRSRQYSTLASGEGQVDHVELLQAMEKPGKSIPPGLVISPPFAVSQRPPSTHSRRASGRVDHYDGYVDDDSVSIYEDDMEEDLHSSPEMQRFIRSMSKTVETTSIGLSFEFENLAYTTRKGKKILQGITGTMPRGSCWGVMGGSGAGKSTFLNVLMGKAYATNGQIRINGHYKDMSKYKKLIGYVPQDDIVFPELTVRENILHSARVRLPAKWRDSQIQEHVDALIACLQLSHVQHSQVGDASHPVISGGQRKRVNIGMELAAAPMAIFLDEPTSGLDSTSAASIMRLLRAISRLGVTTIAIIHQPREQIFYGFDQLLLLAQGRSVYSGPTEDVQAYFETLGFAFPQKANPADTLIDIINGDGAQYTIGAASRQDTDVTSLIDEWSHKGQFGLHVKHLAVSADGTSLSSPYSSSISLQTKRNRRMSSQSINSTAEQEESLRRTMRARGASWPAQTFYCLKRALTQQMRNITSFFFEIAVGGLAGIIIGLSAFAANGHLFQGIYHPPFTILSSAVDYISTPQLGLLSAMAIGLAASAPGFWVFGEEKLMYWRETASGHSRSAYYCGKLLATLPRIALSSLHFTVLLGVLATPLISFQAMYAANFCYFWCIYGLASVVSMLVKREDGPLLAVLASLVIGVLGGVSPPLSKVKMWHMEWLWRSSPGVWYTEAYFTENLTPMSYLYMIDLAAETVGFTLGQFPLDIAVLFLIGLVYRLVAFLGLVGMNRDKQR